jgi:hypothetical protein
MKTQKLATTSSKVRGSEDMFDWFAFTRLEQSLFKVIYETGQALNAFEVYLRVCNSIYNEQIPIEEGIEGHMDMLNRSEILHLMNKRDALKMLKKWQKKGVKFPAYTTIKRMLDNFADLGWLKRREEATGRSVGLYSIPEKIRGQIRDNAQREE